MKTNDRASDIQSGAVARVGLRGCDSGREDGSFKKA